ncbi:NAD(P)/FAD-dependent oxidoreductase [Inquilinus sp. NPDC058860]|uniref:NAD(P)/FAD-dependent oxidoreductase n=1 Tax=Inquilinus sp. NPDC058860 TaxID=3346652 RepID=UPI00368C7A2B
MSPPVDPVASDAALPARVDVVVVGGGIVGAATALSLAEKGLSVALCEKGRIGGEQSSRNWGWCRKMGRDPSELPLAIESLRLWEGMNARVEAETGFRKSGILYLCETPQDIAQHEAWLEHARQFQLDSRLVDGDEIARLLPGAARRWPAALYTPSDGRAEPQKAAPAIAEAARRRGAAVLTGCAVRGIETTAGRVAGVVTEKGPIACDAVVLAGGAWSRPFCGNMDLAFPQLKILGCVMRTAPLEGGPEEAVGASNFAFRKRLDGGYTIAQRNANLAPIVPDSFRLFFDFLPALRKQRHELRLRIGRRFIEEWRLARRWALDQATPFEQVRVLDPVPDDGILDEGRANLVKAFPAFERMVVQERWAGLVDVTPDAVPVISAVDAVPGFFIASGFSGHGFGIGPGAGRLMADLVAGDAPVVDPAPFRYARFAKAPLRAAA